MATMVPKVSYFEGRFFIFSWVKKGGIQPSLYASRQETRRVIRPPRVAVVQVHFLRDSYLLLLQSLTIFDNGHLFFVSSWGSPAAVPQWTVWISVWIFVWISAWISVRISNISTMATSSLWAVEDHQQQYHSELFGFLSGFLFEFLFEFLFGF